MVNSTIQASGEENVGASISTTVAVGVNVSPSGDEWEVEHVEDIAYSEVDAPDWEVEVEYYNEESFIGDISPAEAQVLNQLGYEGVNASTEFLAGITTITIHTIEGNPVATLLSLLKLAFSY